MAADGLARNRERFGAFPAAQLDLTEQVFDLGVLRSGELTVELPGGVRFTPGTMVRERKVVIDLVRVGAGFA